MQPTCRSQFGPSYWCKHFFFLSDQCESPSLPESHTKNPGEHPELQPWKLLRESNCHLVNSRKAAREGEKKKKGKPQPRRAVCLWFEGRWHPCGLQTASRMSEISIRLASAIAAGWSQWEKNNPSGDTVFDSTPRSNLTCLSSLTNYFGSKFGCIWKIQ